MARRVSAADFTEDSFELGHSDFSDEDTTHTSEQSSGLSPDNADESVGIDYFSDFSDLGQLAEIEYGNIDGDVVDDENDENDENNDRGGPSGASYNDHVDDSIDELAEDGSLEGQDFDDLDFSDSSIEDENSDGEEENGRGHDVENVEDQTVEDESNAGDAIEDDDLEFLGQNDFSSPSILNNSPSRRPPARVSSQIVLDSDDDNNDDNERIFHTRRQADPGPFHLVLSLPQNPSAGTPSRPRTTRAGSVTFSSPPATNMSSGARSSTKRRRSNDPGVGPSGTALPPISSILASVGNGSSSSSASSSRAAGSVHGDSQASSSSSSGANNAASQSSRPRISPKRPRRDEPIILDDDLFGSDDDDAGIEMINLVDVDRPQAAKTEVVAKEEKASQKEEPAPAPKNLTKLSAQQCVICMDDMTDITVTHCGHLFCGECLFSSLHSTDQRICPICRTKIELRTPSMSASKMTRSFFPLQLKMRPRR